MPSKSTIKTKKKIPFMESLVSAGFPSPAETFIDRSIDLNEELIDDEPATFFVRVSGLSMLGSGIFPGDTLIVDRSKNVKNGSIIIAIVDGEFTVKKFVKDGLKITLQPTNQNFKEIIIDKNTQFEVWGVVTYVIHSLKV